MYCIPGDRIDFARQERITRTWCCISENHYKHRRMDGYENKCQGMDWPKLGVVIENLSYELQFLLDFVHICAEYNSFCKVLIIWNWSARMALDIWNCSYKFFPKYNNIRSNASKWTFSATVNFCELGNLHANVKSDFWSCFLTDLNLSFFRMTLPISCPIIHRFIPLLFDEHFLSLHQRKQLFWQKQSFCAKPLILM